VFRHLVEENGCVAHKWGEITKELCLCRGRNVINCLDECPHSVYHDIGRRFLINLFGFRKPFDSSTLQAETSATRVCVFFFPAGRQFEIRVSNRMNAPKVSKMIKTRGSPWSPESLKSPPRLMNSGRVFFHLRRYHSFTLVHLSRKNTNCMEPRFARILHSPITQSNSLLF
jgi:hypothetical protein